MPRKSQSILSACLLMLGLSLPILAANEIRMELLWADLEKGDIEASRALLILSSRPQDTVEFLKTKLKPLRLSSGQAKALLLKLGNDDESIWKPAFEELEYLDPRLAIDLQTLMGRYTESPVRQRMVEVLKSGKGSVEPHAYCKLTPMIIDFRKAPGKRRRRLTG